MDFSLKIGYIGNLKWVNNFLQTVDLGYLFVYVQNKTLIHNSFYVLGNWGQILNHRNMQYNYSKKLQEGPSRSG